MIAMEIGTTTKPTKKGGRNARQAKSQVTARTMDVRISIISENIFTTKFRSVYKELHADHETGALTTNKG